MTDLRAKFTLELDDRMSAAARRALGDFAGGVNDVNSAARRGRDALELFTRSGKRAGRGAKDASDDVGLLAAALRRASGASSVMRIAAGNLAAGAVSRAWHAMTGAVVDATGAAVNFEDAMADVAKVARGTDDTPEAFAKITAGAKDTARQLGVLPTEVAKLTSALAPVFSGKEDLVSLSAEVTKVGVAWGVAGGEAGKFFADTTAALGTTRTQTSALFDVINQLSNNMNAQAPVIAEVVTRVGSVAKAASLSGETTAALGAALISTGASAEVAGTGVRTFLARLTAGKAATDSQKNAFRQLGLSAKGVAAALTSGDTTKAEATIQDIIARILALRAEERLPVLIELFGSESIGTIGALATNVELLGQAFGIAGDKAAAAGSVQQEFEKRSKTTRAAIDKLKANVEVLAIQFGDALLPHIQKLSEWLTSPEGQKWGADAVDKAITLVTTLGGAVKDVVGFFGDLVDMFGGGTVAAMALGVAVAGLSGPFGLATVAGVAMGVGIAEGIDRVFNATRRAEAALLGLHNKAQEIRDKEAKAQQDAELADMQASLDAGVAENEKARQVEAAVARWEAAQRKKLGPKITSEQDLELTRKAARQREAILKGGFTSKNFEERLASFEASLPPETGRPAAAVRQAAGGGRSGAGDRRLAAVGGGAAGRGELVVRVEDDRVRAVLRDDALPVGLRLARGGQS